MHSTASDGLLSPEQIVQAALAQGLHCISITDHDTPLGSLAGMVSAREAGITFVPGIEFSTIIDSRDCHLLGYFVDLEDSELLSVIEESREGREDRACAMADRMAEDGFAVSGDAMRASGQTVNRTLLARMLMETGDARDTDDAYARLIGRTSKYYVENELMETPEAIHLIRKAGGFPFVAHPALYKVVDLIPSFKKEGLAGVEVFHSEHTPQDVEILLSLATELGLGVSGGSDWHGDDMHGTSIGRCGLTEKGFERFLRTCERL